MLPTEDELRERYATYSNHRLLHIIHKRKEYTFQAIEAARTELAARDLSAADLDRFLDEQEARETAARMRSCISLKFWEKARFFFMWFAPPWFAGKHIRVNYEENGYALKARQSQIFSIGGFVSSLSSVFTCLHFNSGVFPGLIVFLAFFYLLYLAEKKLLYELTT